MHCKINTPKNGKILKVEINLSLLKMIYIGQFILDFNKLGLKSQRLFLLKSTEKLIIEQKPFVLLLIKRFYIFFILFDAQYRKKLS